MRFKSKIAKIAKGYKEDAKILYDRYRRDIEDPRDRLKDCLDLVEKRHGVEVSADLMDCFGKIPNPIGIVSCLGGAVISNTGGAKVDEEACRDDASDAIKDIEEEFYDDLDDLARSANRKLEDEEENFETGLAQARRDHDDCVKFVHDKHCSEVYDADDEYEECVLDTMPQD